MREGDQAPARFEGRGGHQAWPAAPVLAVALAIGLGFLVHLRQWTFLCDDAFISFRYARNLAAHGSLTYNLPPHAAVEGYTNFLWVVVLAAGDWLGLAPERFAPVLTAVASLGSLVLVALIGAALRRQFAGERPAHSRAHGAAKPPAIELVDLLAPALLAVTPEFVVWGSGGLETSAALALGLLAVHLWLAGKIELAALAAAATGLTRLDELLWVGSFGLAWLVVRGVQRARTSSDAGAASERPPIPWRRVAIGAGLFAAPLVAQLLWRHAYYGQWLPNTWAIKRHGAELREFYGVGYLQFWAANLRAIYLAPLLLLLRPRDLLVAAPLLAQLLWAWSVGGDFMAYGRFLLPATTMLALLVGLALGHGRRLLVARLGWAEGRAALTWAVVAALLLGFMCLQISVRLSADRARAHLHIAGPDPKLTPGFEGVDAMHRFAALRLAAGRALREQVPADTLITVGAAGAMPYGSMLPALDSYGLVDPGVIEAATVLTRERGARPGHQLVAPLDYMRGHDPDLICHIGFAGQRLPPRGFARRRGARAGWVGWACVETGPIPDPRAEGGELPSHYYCCLRPRDRFTELDERALAGRSR